MTKWISKLTKGLGSSALDLKSPTESVVSLPSPSMNYVVGNGGITRGKAAVLFGPESGGKSLLMQLVFKQLLINTAKKEGLIILFDRFSFNRDWWLKLCDNDESVASRLIVKQTNDPLNIFDYVSGDLHEMLQDGAPIVGIGIDSVKSILYPKDMKKKSTDQTMGGGGASYLGPALKQILPVIREYEITTLLVQQVYEEMDQYKKMSNPYIVPDGRALKHFADYMLEITRIDTPKGRLEAGKNIYGGAQQVGHIVRVRAKKNRVGAPFRSGQFSLSYAGGIINQHDELFDLSKALGVLKKPSAVMYQFASYDPVRGEQAMRDWIKDNPQVQKEIEVACCSVGDEVTLEHNKSLGFDDELSGMME